MRARLSALTGSGLLLALQAAAAIYFITDAVLDSMTGEAGEAAWLAWTEILVAVALAIGIGLSALNIRRTLRKSRRLSDALVLARGSFAELLDERFAHWGLSAAEAEVALFSLKGCSIGEIASLRGSAPGTVRSQLSKVYAKAGVADRAGLATSFIEELIDGAEAERAR
ncbi:MULTISPECIES: helix-turn-helix transcriptional regulator [Novosphingopyxis]|uniref:helix-turn-helix transcriptional regulator n=1 Tax=Novosphingopyxis TaxID=2709686 RepID=UPI001651295F|nr:MULTISPECIES: hypothetical protein [Novosphingopyxis]MBH9537701.1 hypothetical protein [Novosphingopyxis sp. YJ-S2-01]|tara:strand:+ start:1298 stop:1804 length:507 start_codon:yes stop_codon:yes gene_type:complete